jgi:hypothetical protein
MSNIIASTIEQYIAAKKSIEGIFVDSAGGAYTLHMIRVVNPLTNMPHTYGFIRQDTFEDIHSQLAEDRAIYRAIQCQTWIQTLTRQDMPAVCDVLLDIYTPGWLTRMQETLLHVCEDARRLLTPTMFFLRAEQDGTSFAFPTRDAAAMAVFEVCKSRDVMLTNYDLFDATFPYSHINDASALSIEKDTIYSEATKHEFMRFAIFPLHKASKGAIPIGAPTKQKK